MMSPEARRQVRSAYSSVLNAFLKSYPFHTKDGSLYELHEGSVYIWVEVGEEGIAGGYDIKIGSHRITGTFAWEEGYQSLLDLLRFLKSIINEWS